MSSRKSSASGQGLPFSRYGQRTPLKSLDNEIPCLSNSTSRVRLKARFNVDPGKMTTVDVPLTDPEPLSDFFSPTKLKQSIYPSADMAASQIPCEIGDVTFKSFICAGGEVQVSDCSPCAEESINLPKDQVTTGTITEDTVISNSMLQSGCEHIEHPYHNPDTMEPNPVDISEPRVCPSPSTTLASGDLDEKQATENLRSFLECSEDKNVTWKSFVCDGGEVEVLDATRPEDDTIPLPETELAEPTQDNTVNSTYSSDVFDQLCEGDHADHLYCATEEDGVPFIATFSETIDGFVKQITGQTDVTSKSFNCPGGEIEFFEETKFFHESVFLPENQTVTIESHSHGTKSSTLPDEDLQNGTDNSDHQYCNDPNYSPPLSKNFTQEPLPCSSDAVEVEMKSQQESATTSSFITEEGEAEKTDTVQLSEKTSPLPEDHFVICQPVEADCASAFALQDNKDSDEEHSSLFENAKAVLDTSPPTNDHSSLAYPTLKPLDNEAVYNFVQEIPQSVVHPEYSAVLSVVHESETSDRHLLPASPESFKLLGTQPCVEDVSEVSSTLGHAKSSEEKDSALGSSGNGAGLCDSAEKPCDVLKLLSEGALPMGVLTPVVRRMSLALLKARGDLDQNQFLSDDLALEEEKNFLVPADIHSAGLWAEHLESPMPRPLFNSTGVACKPQSGPVTEPVGDAGDKLNAVPQSDGKKLVQDIPLIPDGPLEQQLRKMAEFLILASGKMYSTAVSSPVDPSGAVMAPSVRAAPVESHSVCVGTSPIKLVDHSLNTSGLFERKREFSVVDSCTLTDSLLWNSPPGSLECLSIEELKKRLMSSMIMIEALAQQVAAARARNRLSTGCPPSDLREKLVQTDHTELSQTTMYRDLYVEALHRIDELELDGSSLQNLMQHMQVMRITMTSLSGDTDAALSNMEGMSDIIRSDHQSLVSHYGHLKSLFDKSKETHQRMMQKVKEALEERDGVRTQMEEASTAREAAFSVMDQLRSHCASEMSELEKSLGSQQELLMALKQMYPVQVSLKEACIETLDSASSLLSQTTDEQCSLMKELLTVRSLLQKAAPMLRKLNEKAAAALTERDEHIYARDQAIEEREQVEETLNETNLSLQNANEQISDLNLQVTILTSEMGVLRQKLTEKEEDTQQLQSKVTELTTTISTTLASYTYLEQTLATEYTRLQQSWEEAKQARERANELEVSLDQSTQRVCELTQALARSEEQLSQLRTHSETQDMQILQLQDACTELNSMQEMNEFLLDENRFTREQVTESESMLRENLQGLRERNIQCEDLKAEVSHLQLENRSLQEELETTRLRASTNQREVEEKMVQAGSDITLLLHTLRGLTNHLNDSLTNQKPELQTDRESQPVNNVEQINPPSSFVNSIMLALTTEKEDDGKTETTSGLVSADEPDPQCETLFSETSAFTRIAAIPPKKSLHAVQTDSGEEELSRVAELLSHLGSTVTELVNTLKLVRQHKDDQLKELHNNFCGLQVEQQAANIRHNDEVYELKLQLSQLNTLVQRGNQALQQKTQDEKTLTRLMTEVQEAQETLNKYKTDNNELRRDAGELRLALRQSKVESEFLREELRKAGGQSTNPTQFMEEKIQLLKEVERQKARLQEMEQAKVKLLERAKRHQIIYQNNQQKSEKELQMLNHMINKIREVLRSLPEDVKNGKQLQQLFEYIG